MFYTTVQITSDIHSTISVLSSHRALRPSSMESNDWLLVLMSRPWWWFEVAVSCTWFSTSGWRMCSKYAWGQNPTIQKVQVYFLTQRFRFMFNITGPSHWVDPAWIGLARPIMNFRIWASKSLTWTTMSDWAGLVRSLSQLTETKGCFTSRPSTLRKVYITSLISNTEIFTPKLFGFYSNIAIWMLDFADVTLIKLICRSHVSAPIISLFSFQAWERGWGSRRKRVERWLAAPDGRGA